MSGTVYPEWEYSALALVKDTDHSEIGRPWNKSLEIEEKQTNSVQTGELLNRRSGSRFSDDKNCKADSDREKM